MKKITLIALMLFTAFGYAQVGINTNNPDASSALEIESTTGGILIPRLTETQRDAISAPATGLMIYQTDQTAGFYFYDGNVWTKIDGVAGPAGAAGVDGDDGATGPAGPTGPQGDAGPAGAAGVDGDDGATGPAGPAGPTGPAGAAGPTGPAGADGDIGVTGSKGETGAAGIDGAQGPAGADGDIGVTGSKGETGAAGIDGAQGPTGPAGADGDDGATGPAGPAGAAGPTGPAGADGDDGATGLTGPAGPTGPQGDAGIDGVAGPQGDAGPAGAAGVDGSTPPGTQVGQMNYWNGTTWQTINPGNAGSVLQLVGTTPTWVSNPDIVAPVITLTGNATVTIELGATYTDAGATATDLSGATAIPDPTATAIPDPTVTVSGAVDTSTIGSYTITYTATDASGNVGTATRTVNVVDTTAPVITVTSGTDTVEQGSTWTDAGATADGDETVSVSGAVDTSTIGSYTITYTAEDAYGNVGTATRTVTVNPDTTAPVITVTSGTDTVEQGSTWTDAGATADGDETVSVSGTVDTSTIGSYTITYTATDASGNVGTATRTVTVNPDTTAPVITVTSGTDTVEQGSTWTDAGATADGDETVTVSGTVDTSTIGSYTITYTATDASGNVGTADRTVNVFSIAVGDFYQGGVVFHLFEDGETGYVSGETHGLIAAVQDQSSFIRWYNGSYVTTRALRTALGTGATNTTTIISVQGATETSYAAGLARAYTGGGYTDWFLPSKDELNKMYLNRATINTTAASNSGSDFGNSFYWSSTEYDDLNAWMRNLFNGDQSPSRKKFAKPVRAVRAF